jgi:hypothetical protein
MAEIKLRAVSVAPGRFEYRCGWTTDGRDWEPVGCSHPRPREAGDHADTLMGPRTRPATPDRVPTAAGEWDDL